MARYTATVRTPRSPADVFAYLSDFSTTEEWDPGVVRASRRDAGPVAVGSEVDLVARFLGRENALTYTVTALDAPHAVTVRGESATVVSIDTITFVPDGDGTRVTYDAVLKLKGPLGLLDPLLGLAFGRVGDNALTGMCATLDAEPVG